MELGQLPQIWAGLERLRVGVEQLDAAYERSQILTARRLDEAQPAGIRVYISAHRLINVGFDNLTSLQWLLEDRGATVWAPWTLLRAVFESGFHALWVLEPDDGASRRLRGLRLEVMDFRERERFRKCFPPQSKAAANDATMRDANTTTKYKSEAAALGVKWEQLTKPNLVDELKKLRTVGAAGADMPLTFEGAWRALSGLQHGYAYASAYASDMEAATPIPGGQRVTMSIRDEGFQALGMTACFLLHEATALYFTRCSRVS